MLKSLVFVLAFGLSFSALGQTCPVAAGESTLSLSQVMRNFGSSLNAADLAILTQNMSDTQLVQAVSGIEIAIACSQAVLDAHGEALLPVAFEKIPLDQRAQYVQMFLKYMGEFQVLLVEYKNMFIAQQALPLASRDVKALDLKRREIREQALLAHDEL